MTHASIPAENVQNWALPMTVCVCHGIEDVEDLIADIEQAFN